LDEAPEPDGDVVPLEPVLPLPLVPDEAGLPVVPVSPVLDVPAVPEVLEPEAPMPPEAEPDVDEGELDEAVLPELDGSVLLVLLEGEVLDVDDGEVDELDDEPAAPVAACLSQPATAAPAKARTATTEMIFFMTSPMLLSVWIDDPRCRGLQEGTHNTCHGLRAL